MNRRKPRQSFAVVPNEGGLNEKAAVLQKAARRAIASLVRQFASRGHAPRPPELLAFAAGYLAGFARHQGLRHGVDAEQDMAPLLSMLAAEAPEAVRPMLSSLVFSARPVSPARAQLGAEASVADAGYLTGHLESLCGSAKLLGLAEEVWGTPDAAARYLTACDTAADRMQTHQPTAALRFDQAERAILREAFSPSAE